MSQRFLNGMIMAKAQMAISLIAEIQSFNAASMEVLSPLHEEALGHGVMALSDISNKLREADHDREET